MYELQVKSFVIVNKLDGQILCDRSVSFHFNLRTSSRYGPRIKLKGWSIFNKLKYQKISTVRHSELYIRKVTGAVCCKFPAHFFTQSKVKERLQYYLSLLLRENYCLFSSLHLRLVNFKPPSQGYWGPFVTIDAGIRWGCLPPFQDDFKNSFSSDRSMANRC